MGESTEHIKLIGIMLDNLPYFITENMKAFILKDLPNSKNKPPILFSKHRPDIYLDYDDILFIGEAKIQEDVLSNHSIEQYDNYLTYCNMFNGNSYLSIIVPWHFSRTIKNYLKNIKVKKNLNVNIIVYNDIGYMEFV